jgi:hypothetical protein
MGLVELPLYMPKQTEQFSNNQRLRPDLQAKARRGEAAYGLLDTAVGGALNLLSQFKKAKEQRQEDEISRRNLAFDSKVHELALRLSERPLSASSEEVAGYGEDKLAMPNYSYTQEQLEYFSADALDGVSDRKVREAVALHIQGKRVTASDSVFKWDSDQAKITALSNLANTVQTYENQRDLAGATGAIDSARASGWIDNEAAIKYKNNVRLNISVGGLGLQARSLSAQEGLALLENPENMKWQMEGGALSEIPAETQKALVAEYKQEKTLQDDQHKTGFVDVFINTNTIAQCDAALSQVGATDFLDPSKKKEIVNWFMGRRNELVNNGQDTSKGRTDAEDAWYKANEDRLAGQVAVFIQKGKYREASRLIQGALVEKKAIRGEFAAKQLGLVQPGDDAAFDAIVRLVNKAVERLPPDQQGAVGADVFSWYRSLPSQPTNEQIQRVIYDAQVASFRKAADNFYDYKKQSSELQKGAAEMSMAEQSTLLAGSAGFARSYAERKFPTGEWGVDFTERGAYAYPDADNLFGLGRGHPVIRAGDGKSYYALVADKDGRDVTLKKWVVPGSGSGYWTDAQKLPPKKPNIPAGSSAAPGAAPVPSGSAGDLTKIPKTAIEKYKGQDISATWDEATKGITGRGRTMLPTTKESQIAWLIKQGYLSE